jgi:hypothetical protein
LPESAILLAFNEGMFITTHALIGALVANAFPHHPAVSFGLGMASHFLTDIIPHGDSRLYKDYISGSKKKSRKALAYVLLDGVAAIYMVLFLLNIGSVPDQLTLSLGIAGGVLPDLLVGLYEVTRISGLRWFHRLHFFFHNFITSRKGDVAFHSGLAIQFSFLALVCVKLFD